jgi:hypothetical protein
MQCDHMTYDAAPAPAAGDTSRPLTLLEPYVTNVLYTNMVCSRCCSAQDTVHAAQAAAAGVFILGNLLMHARL